MTIATTVDYSSYMLPVSMACSNDALMIEDLLEKIRAREETVDREITLEESRQALWTLYNETFQPDWDGYGAAAIPAEAFEEAWRLLELLPSSIPIPEILPEPDGEIGLEWYRNNRFVFVVSVSGKHRINYAGIFGDNKTHGTEYFGESLPPVLMENLKRLYFQ